MHRSFRILACSLFAGLAGASVAADKAFRAGAAAINISPQKLPAIIAGGFLEGRATQINDRLHARCIVLDDGKTKIAFAIVDTCMMTRPLIDEAKAVASKECGIAMDHMMVSATHTHSAPAAMACLGTRLDKDYAAFLPGKIAEGIVVAAKNLQPARIGWASIDDWEHTHNRRWIRRPDRLIVDPFGNATGRANMHPGYLSPDVVGPSGPVDPGLSVLSIQTWDGKPLAVLANYSQHYFGSPAISADYYGLFCKHIAGMLGQPGDGNGPFVCAMSQGTSGDLMWMDYGSPKKNFTTDSYAEAVATYAARALKDIAYHDSVPLAIVEKKLELKYRVPDAKRLEWAIPIASLIENDLPKDKQQVYAKEAIILHERQKTELKLQAIRVGGLTISTLPNEVYALTGLKLKAQSPFTAHFNIELANGAEGYIPPPEQHALGGYTTWPARTAGLEVRAEPEEVEALLGALEEVTGQKRRVVRDENGPYAEAVIAARPVAYWRLEDMTDHAFLRSAVAIAGKPGSREANFGLTVTGCALHLPGVGSGSGCGAQERLTPSQFSGPTQINRSIHVAGGKLDSHLPQFENEHSIALWFWNGLPLGGKDLAAVDLLAAGSSRVSISSDRDSMWHLATPGPPGSDGTPLRSRMVNGVDPSAIKHGPTALLRNAWHFLVFTRKGNRTTVYLDGKEEMTSEVDGWPGSKAFQETLPIIFGNGLEGKIDEIAVFNRVLAVDEVGRFWKLSGITEYRAKEMAELHRAAGEAELRVQPPQATDVPSPKPGLESLALSPEESLRKIHVPEGYEVELVAAEPLVLDPVAFDWDERGRLWVAEMADYPLGMDGNGKPGGRVRILEDTDGDGRYDKATLFADGLNFPTGILCWRGGCLVTAAPDVLFLKDTKGAGKADVQQKLLTGFLEGNQQLRVNGLRWGLDGWVYCANGGHNVNYGKDIAITSTLTGEKIALGSRDFRFKPDTGEFDPLSGPSQFGRNRDVWNHWFGVQNSYPIWHYVLEDRYLRRNPHVAPPSPKNVMTGSNPPVYPVSGEQKRYHSFNQAGHFTSACAATPYLDTLLFGDGKEMHSFTCEPVHNVVQRFIVEADGVSFKARRAGSESQPDFFASEDRWCRPVMTRTGPDGALWIADMYRYMVEHPQWLPENGKNDFLPFYRAGDDKGRIYRIFPKGKRPATVKPLERMGADELVNLFESPNGWLRDRAQMLLQARADKGAVAALEKLAKESKQPLARAHALTVLESLDALNDDTLITALRDEAAGVREHALRLAEKHGDDAVVSASAKLADDANAKVRLQLALSLGEWKQPAAGEALVKLAGKDRDDAMIRGAVISSLLPHLGVAARKLQSDPALMEPLLRTALSEKREEIVLVLSLSIVRDAAKADEKSMRLFRTLLQLLGANGVSVEMLASRHLWDAAWTELAEKKAKLIDNLKRTANDESKSASGRAFASTLLLADPKEATNAVTLLGRLIGPRENAEPFGELVSLLARSEDARVPDFLIADWDARTPSQRLPLLDALMGREAWTAALLAQVKVGRISASSFDALRQARLLKHPSANVRKIAAEVFASTANSPRAKVLEAFKPALSIKGDPAKGKALFAQACIACHQLDGAGRVLGPDLRSVVGHDPEKLLNSILDPSANIEPGFTAYFCELKSGEQLYGIIAGESGGSIGFKLADATTRNLLRTDIGKLQSSKASLMPDGMEALLTPQSLADLIAYLKVPK